MHDSRRDFTKLWAAMSVSLVGSEVTALALPLIAVVTLDASPLQMGLLVAARELPFLLFSLPAGVHVDRVRRRPLLIATDLGSALLLLSVPLALPLGGPTFEQLCLVAFGIGAFTVVAEVAHYAYVPVLVGRERLAHVNSRLQLSYSASASAGPGLGGLLIQLVSAPVAILLDAASFVVSAVLVGSIRRPEAAPERDGGDTPLGRAVGDGLRFLLRHRYLRPILVGGAILNLFDSAFLAVYILFATRELGLDAATLGIVFALGGLGAIPGAILATRVGDRLGVGRTILAGWASMALASLIVPLASGPWILLVVLLGSAKALAGLTFTIANIHQWTLRQAVTPDRLAGRVTAGHRFLTYGAGALGAVLGGVVATVVGLRWALAVAAAGMLVGTLVAAASPLRTLRRQPAMAPGDR